MTAQKRKPTAKEMQKMLESVDLDKFWRKVLIKVSAEADAFEYARAKSRGNAANYVLL